MAILLRLIRTAAYDWKRSSVVIWKADEQNHAYQKRQTDSEAVSPKARAGSLHSELEQIG